MRTRGAFTKTGWAATLAALLAVGWVTIATGADEAERPIARRYVATPAAPLDETPAQATTRSAGCLTCHTASDAPSMHKSDAVVIGCADCHGGDATVAAKAGMLKTSVEYTRLRDAAHVLPRYPKTWGYPHSAKPQRSYTLLNREAPEFIRFVNPGDYRVARLSCGACHLPVIQAAERSLMSTSAMFFEGASYNNGVLPYKNAVLGEAYTADGQPAKLLSPGSPPGTVTAAQEAHGARPTLYPLPRWQVTEPGDVFRVFERGGRNIGSQFPEIGLPDATGELQRLEEPGRPDIRQSNRGPGTGLRVAIPVLNLHKTRLNDPLMWFLGTNDQPGDYRSSGLFRLPRGLRQRPPADPQPGLQPVWPRRSERQRRPDHRQARERPPDRPRLHQRHPDVAVHDLPHAPAEYVPEQLPRLHHVGLRERRAIHVAGEAGLPDWRAKSGRFSIATRRAPRRVGSGPASTSCATSLISIPS